MPKDIKKLILRKLQKRGKFTIQEIREEVPVTRQAIHKHIKDLLNKGEIVKIGSTRGAKYINSNKSPGITQHVLRTYQRV